MDGSMNFCPFNFARHAVFPQYCQLSQNLMEEWAMCQNYWKNLDKVIKMLFHTLSNQTKWGTFDGKPCWNLDVKSGCWTLVSVWTLFAAFAHSLVSSNNCFPLSQRVLARIWIWNLRQRRSFHLRTTARTPAGNHVQSFLLSPMLIHPYRYRVSYWSSYLVSNWRYLVALKVIFLYSLNKIIGLLLWKERQRSRI